MGFWKSIWNGNDELPFVSVFQFSIDHIQLETEGMNQQE